MIPAAFDYHRPESLDEAIALLGEHGDEAKILAGGHSLLPLMRLRLAAPEVVIDVGRLDELKGVCEDGDWLSIGALTTHVDVMDNDLVTAKCPGLADAIAQVGDPQVRNRGTIGGALAHGDAAGDLPAVMLAMGAELVAKGPQGTRRIAVADFFVDYLETALGDDEVLTEVRVPSYEGWGHAYIKFSRVAQAWAIVGASALTRRDNGRIAEARIGLTHMGSVPVRAEAMEEALGGADASSEAVVAAAEHAADGTEPPSDLNADAEYRKHLARVLARRAVERAAGL